MNTPLVSFIVSVYNTKSFADVKHSVENMLNQTYPNVEVVLCDDGSTNGVYEYLLSEYRENPRVRIIRNAINSGCGACLNQAITYAKGVYLARQDDDDYSTLDRIQREVEILEKHPEFALVSGGLAKFDKDGIWSTTYIMEYPEKRDFRIHSQHVHAASLFRRECLESVGGYRIARETVRAEDYDLFMRLYAAGYQGYNIQDVLYYYNYPRDNSKKSKYKYRIYEAIVRFKGYRAMRLPARDYVYVARPLITGLLSTTWKERIKKLLGKEG